MDKITKALKKLSGQERATLETILSKIKINSLSGLDVKKLKDRKNIFRVRKGKIRVIFQANENGTTDIIALERRCDKTYSNS